MCVREEWCKSDRMLTASGIQREPPVSGYGLPLTRRCLILGQS
jgi:hypothetical protein